MVPGGLANFDIIRHNALVRDKKGSRTCVDRYLICKFKGLSWRIISGVCSNGLAHEVSLLNRNVLNPTHPRDKEDPATFFLLLCLRAEFDPDSLEEARLFAEQEKLDWDSVAMRIEQNSLASLVYAIVRGQDVVPPQMEARLHQEFIDRAICKTYLLRELETVVQRLDQEGTEAILLKGAALSLTAYSSTFPRYFADLDLLVRREDVNQVMDALLELGYAAAGSVQLRTGDFLPFVNEWQVTKAGELDVEIDLHWHLFGWIYYQQIPLDWFWQTAVPVTVGASPARVLGPEAQILHLCLHVFQHRGQAWAFSLRLLHDIAQVLAHYQAQIDWQLLLNKTEAFHVVLPVQQVLQYVWENWPVFIPPEIADQIRDLQPTPGEERAFTLARSVAGDSDAHFAAVGLANLPDWRSRLLYLSRNVLFPPAAYMRHRYNIQRRYMLPFYYPYRWYLGLASAFNR
jgi:hypothetical protein